MDEVIEEARLDEASILAAIDRFVADRGDRVRRPCEVFESVGVS